MICLGLAMAFLFLSPRDSLRQLSEIYDIRVIRRFVLGRRAVHVRVARALFLMTGVGFAVLLSLGLVTENTVYISIAWLIILLAALSADWL